MSWGECCLVVALVMLEWSVLPDAASLHPKASVESHLSSQVKIYLLLILNMQMIVVLSNS